MTKGPEPFNLSTPVDGRTTSPITAARSFRDSPVHADVRQVQTDHAVVDVEGQRVELFAESGGGPGAQPAADRAVRTLR